MSDAKRGLDEQVRKVYGDQIAAYARGSDALEKAAVNVSIPVVAALTMPEEYAVIVLTSRMDNELRKLLERALHRQGDPEEQLFDFNMPFSTFSSKTVAAYSFGFLTKKMYEAIKCCRKIRNAYAHADNPDDARASKDYLKHKSRLLDLDRKYTHQAIDTFRQLHDQCAGIIGVTAERSDVSAIMLAVCRNLGSATFFALATIENPPRVVPAFFGPGDAIQAIKDRQIDRN